MTVIFGEKKTNVVSPALDGITGDWKRVYGEFPGHREGRGDSDRAHQIPQAKDTGLRIQGHKTARI